MSVKNAQVKDEKLIIEIEMPAKKFRTGKQGFYWQGSTTVNGTEYRLNFQAYKKE